VKKDISFPEVRGVMLAIARKPVQSDYVWHAYIINTNNYPLENLLIVSKGYSAPQHPKQDTSILRHSIGLLKSKGYAIIEPLDPSVFKLFNEFWISYYYNEQMYDKRFIFTPGSISDNHLVSIDALELEGVLHI
jgi:hypothetical protein